MQPRSLVIEYLKHGYSENILSSDLLDFFVSPGPEPSEVVIAL